MASLRTVAFIVLAIFLVSVSHARAGCYPTIGCTDKNAFQLRDLRKLSCEMLHQIPADIYTENGFCWKVWTDANRNCRYTTRASLPLNPIERANLRAIDRALIQKPC